MESETAEVFDRPERGRYEVAVDGETVGYCDRSVADGRMVLPHTVVDPAHRGQGLAAVLVRHVLDDARRQDLRVVPRCWYVAEFIDRHPEYRDLVA